MFQTRLDAAPFDPEDLVGLRARIDAETAGGYGHFRTGLKADHAQVRRDLALGYAGLVLAVAMTGIVGFLFIPVGAVLIGFAIAYLQLFIHEAAHFGLASDRAANDRLANRLICWQVGTEIAAYRETHWEHHRSLGGPKDTEVSYRHRLSPGFVLAMLTGIHALRVFRSRKQMPGAGRRRQTSRLKPLLTGVTVHAIILLALVAIGWWPAAIAWIGGMAVCFPFFATLRQLLEHRPAAGDGGANAVSRLFGDGPFASIFGGAGFNRHLLHHLEPQVSYTRLGDLEAYLMATSAAAELDARRSTYAGAFAALIRSDRNG